MAKNPFFETLTNGFNAVRQDGRLGDMFEDFGYGLLKGKNWQKAMEATAEHGAEMRGIRADERTNRQKLEQQQAQTNATMQWLQDKAQSDPRYAPLVAAAQGGAPMGEVWQAALKVGAAKPPIEVNGQLVDPDTYEVLGDFRNPDQMTPGGDVSFGVTPIWGQKPDGTYGYGVQGDDGTFRPVDTGDMTMLDPRTLNAEKAAGTAIGKGQGNAVFDLPQAEWTADTTIREIDAILNNKQGMDELFGNTLGIPNVMTPTWPGSPKANITAQVDQIKGRTFLQAYEMLRGGGQITEVEGRKAEEAMARLSTAQDRQTFEAALRDLQSAVRDGLTKLRQQATMPVTPPPGTAPGSTDLRSKYGLE